MALSGLGLVLCNIYSTSSRNLGLGSLIYGHEDNANAVKQEQKQAEDQMKIEKDKTDTLTILDNKQLKRRQ